MEKHIFSYNTESSEFDESIPSQVETTCNDELTLEEILAVFEKHLIAAGYILPEGQRVGLVNEL